MKRKTILFFIYCVVLVLSLVGLLVFCALIKEKDNTNTSPNSATNNDKPNDSEDNKLTDNNDDHSSEEDGSNEIEEIVYATELNINIDGEIQIYRGEKIKILDSIVTVKPKEMKSLLKYSITSRYGSDPSEVEFDGSYLTASSSGQYNLVYRVLHKGDEFLEKRVVIKVLDTDAKFIEQVKDTIRINKEANFNDYFDVYLPIDRISITSSQHLEINNDKIKAKNVGLGELDIIYRHNYIQREYMFQIEVLDNPKYYMEITIGGDIINVDPDNNLLNINVNKGINAFGCCIYDALGNSVAQDIVINMSNNNAELLSSLAGMVIINCTASGEVTITIKSNLDKSLEAIILMTILN